MDTTKLLEGLQTGLDAVEKLAPIVKAIGGPDLVALASMARTLAEIAANTLKRIEEGKLVASEREAAVIRAIIAELASANDALAEYIARS